MEKEFDPELQKARRNIPSAEARQKAKGRLLELQNLHEELDELKAELKRAESVEDQKLAGELRSQIALTTEAMGGEPVITEKELRASDKAVRELRERKIEKKEEDDVEGDKTELDLLADKQEQLVDLSPERRKKMIQEALKSIQDDEATDIRRRESDAPNSFASMSQEERAKHLEGTMRKNSAIQTINKAEAEAMVSRERRRAEQGIELEKTEEYKQEQQDGKKIA